MAYYVSSVDPPHGVCFMSLDSHLVAVPSVLQQSLDMCWQSVVTSETSIVFLPFQPDFDVPDSPEPQEEPEGVLLGSFRASVASARLNSIHENVIGVNKKTLEQLSIPQDCLVNVVCAENGLSHLAHVTCSSVCSTSVLLSPVLAWNLQVDKMESCTVAITPVAPSEKPHVAREVVLARVSSVNLCFRCFRVF